MPYTLLKVFLLLALVIQASFSTAAETTSSLSWEAPKTRQNAEILTQEEIAEYRIYHEVDAVPTLESPVVSVPGSVLTHDIVLTLMPRPEPYTVSFAITAVDTDGNESQLTNTVSKSFDLSSLSAPSAPVEVRLTVICNAGCSITVTSP